MTDTPETSTASDEKIVSIPGGAVEMEVEHRDGTKEMVKVRQLPISRIQRYAIAVSFGDDSIAIELYCDKPKDWADTLAPESANAIVEKGKEINGAYLAAWFRHQEEWRKILNIGSREKQPGVPPNEKSS